MAEKNISLDDRKFYKSTDCINCKYSFVFNCWNSLEDREDNYTLCFIDFIKARGIHGAYSFIEDVEHELEVDSSKCAKCYSHKLQKVLQIRDDQLIWDSPRYSYPGESCSLFEPKGKHDE